MLSPTVSVASKGGVGSGGGTAGPTGAGVGAAREALVAALAREASAALLS